MHLLGTITSVHFMEKERQHALKYSRAVPNAKAHLQHLEMTYDMSDMSDDLLTKLEEFVCHICRMQRKDRNFGL